VARIDLARRAEIGRDRRLKTRAQLVAATRVLYAERAIDAVTVDDLVSAAQVAKGTFYVHFASLSQIQAAVADELAQEFDELLQARRLAITDPVERVAAGCGAFIAQAIASPAWAALVARGAESLPNFAARTRVRVLEDLEAAAGRIGGVTPDLAAEFVFAIVLQAIRLAAAGQLPGGQAPAIIAGVLRAIGLTNEDAQSIVRRVLNSDDT